MKSEKVAMTHLAIVIHLQTTTDHVESMEYEAECVISPKCSKCKNVQVKTGFLNTAKISITHIALGLRLQ